MPARPLLVSNAVAARVLGVDPATLYRLAAAGEAPIEPVRVGRSIRWRVAELAKFAGVSADAIYGALAP